MDLMSLSARDLTQKCLDVFESCLNFCPGQLHDLDDEPPPIDKQSALSTSKCRENQRDERFEYRLADFNLWIDGIGALAPSKASLDTRLIDRPIDLSLVKGNLIMLYQSLEHCLGLLRNESTLGETLLDIDSALESLVSLSLAIRRTGRRSRLHKADRLFDPEEHVALRRHLEAIIILRPGHGRRDSDKEFQQQMDSLTSVQRRLVHANLRRRNRFIQAQLHSLGLKKRTLGFELPIPEMAEVHIHPVTPLEEEAAEPSVPIAPQVPQQPIEPLPRAMSATSASVPESKLEYKEPALKKTESAPMTVITQITASARYPRPRLTDQRQQVVQCPCCYQMLPLSEAKNNNRWRNHLAEDIRPYTCIFDNCPTPDMLYSSRAVLEQHFRQDHPPVWQCPMCGDGPAYPTMTEIMDHFHESHPASMGEGLSATISSSAQTRMGIDNCPLCDVFGELDSPELIDHVLEHVHDFSLRSLPWPESAYVDLGGEVGSFDLDRAESDDVLQWLKEYEHEGDIDPTLSLSSCDHDRLPIITEQTRFEPVDKLGLDILFADEHGDESAVAETEVSELSRPLSSSEETSILEDSEYFSLTEEQSTRERKFSLRRLFRGEVDPVSIAVGGPALWIKGMRSLGIGRRDESQPSTDSTTFERFPGLSSRAYYILIGVLSNLSSVYGQPYHPQFAFLSFLRDVQGELSASLPKDMNKESEFMDILFNSYMDALKPLPPKDVSKPISNYFINSSYKTYLSRDNPPYTASPGSYREALLNGCRLCDMDVWDCDQVPAITLDALGVNETHELPKGSASLSKRISRIFRPDNEEVGSGARSSQATNKHPSSIFEIEPIVMDNRNPSVACKFRDVCSAIRESAFDNNILPVIVCLRLHADPSQQEMIVQIIKEEWHGLLLDAPLEGHDTRIRFPTLYDLRFKILVECSGAISNTSEKERKQGDIFGISNNLYGSGQGPPRPINDGTLGRPSTPQIWHNPVIPSLGRLAIYTQSQRFNGFNREYLPFERPADIIRISKNMLDATTPVSSQVLKHSKESFFCVSPDDTVTDSPSLNPLQCWRRGVQMAAIKRQTLNSMMLNQGMFADEDGWALKPQGYLSTDQHTPTEKLQKLRIFVFETQTFKLVSSGGATVRSQDLSPLSRIKFYWVPGLNMKEVNAIRHKDEGSGIYGYNFDFSPDDFDIIPQLSFLWSDSPQGRMNDTDYSNQFDSCRLQSEVNSLVLSSIRPAQPGLPVHTTV